MTRKQHIEMVALDRFTLDPELQPRAAIDKVLMEEYGQHIIDGVAFPPVVAFDDGNALLLSDGFHRWHTHKALDLGEIATEIRQGDRQAALRHSLSANATHGARRSAADYRRAYGIACNAGLVEATDSDGVHALLGCSGRWADDLTADARAKARAERDAQIAAKAAEGKSGRQIARELGIAEGTVRNVAAQQAQPSVSAHPEPVAESPVKPAWIAKLDELETPAARAWSRALAALRSINEQATVDALFADRFTGFDHVVKDELRKAVGWINTFHHMFGNE